MSAEHLSLLGRKIEIQRKPIKNTYLKIYPPHGRICISAPLNVSSKALSKWVKNKQEWIEKQLTKIEHQKPTEMPATLQNGMLLAYLGNQYQLKIRETAGPCHIVCNHPILELHLPPNKPNRFKQQLLEDWYRQQMKSLVPELVEKWQMIIGVQVLEWGIKRMKTRWGSCNIKAARIWLNLELIKKPRSCLESVLVHEMIHLLEPSHNKRFYALMDQFMPTWREYQQPLKNHSLSSA